MRSAIVLLGAAIAGSAIPSVLPAQEPLRVICFGDSLTSAAEGYGISESPLIKCRVGKNTLTLINTAPHDVSLAVISPEYVSKKLERVRTKTVTLPPYDVTAPEQGYELDLYGFNPGADIWLTGAGKAVRVTYAERIGKK